MSRGWSSDTIRLRGDNTTDVLPHRTAARARSPPADDPSYESERESSAVRVTGNRSSRQLEIQLVGYRGKKINTFDILLLIIANNNSPAV